MFLLPQELGNALLSYLAQRPYVEVHAMIQGLQELTSAPKLIEPEAAKADN